MGYDIQTLNIKQGSFTDAAFLPDGQSFACIVSKAVVDIYDTHTLELISRFKSDDPLVTFSCIAAHPSTGILLLGTERGGFAKLDWQNAQLTHFESAESTISICAINPDPDGRTVVTFSLSGKLVQWDIRKGEPKTLDLSIPGLHWGLGELRGVDMSRKKLYYHSKGIERDSLYEGDIQSGEVTEVNLGAEDYDGLRTLRRWDGGYEYQLTEAHEFLRIKNEEKEKIVSHFNLGAFLGETLNSVKGATIFLITFPEKCHMLCSVSLITLRADCIFEVHTLDSKTRPNPSTPEDVGFGF